MFFSSVSYIGESQFVDLRHLYILFVNQIEFIIPIAIHVFFLYSYLFIFICFDKISRQVKCGR